MRIGLIGAGMMGRGMAISLLRAGHQVTVIAHRNRAPVDDLVARGAREVKSLSAIAADSEVIILCVTTSKVVEETILALKPYLRGGQIVIDSGTSEPDTTRRLARELARSGIGYADAPLTGGPDQAEKGELGVLCGADDRTFTAIEPLLKCVATTIRHFGPPGSGHSAKLVSNYLVTGMIALVAEAFAAARKARLDWGDLYDVMLNGSGNSGVLRKMVPPALAGDFNGYRFSIANAAKDIGYYVHLAESLDCQSNLAEAVASIFAKAVEADHGGRYVSGLLDPAFDDRA
jgi:3-hydroxyisobutyrate dehydrogenase-like beta-hydroxyacid dehydrogenase